MPRKPDFTEASSYADARLDPFRDRAAVLVRDGKVVMRMLVQSDFTCSELGGHLWWRRWSTPREFLRLLGEDQEGE